MNVRCECTSTMAILHMDNRAYVASLLGPGSLLREFNAEYSLNLPGEKLGWPSCLWPPLPSQELFSVKRNKISSVCTRIIL